MSAPTKAERREAAWKAYGAATASARKTYEDALSATEEEP